MDNVESKKDSISFALGISEEWVKTTSKLAKDVIIDTNTCSEAIEKMGKALKDAEFNGDYELGRYEKQMIYSGMILSLTLEHIKKTTGAIAGIGSLGSTGLGEILLSSLFASLSRRPPTTPDSEEKKPE
jgi:hypothetical protein